MTTYPDWVGRLGSSFGRRTESAARPRIALAPGRVNLIGEHTDYNDGWVLPMAIDRWVGVAFAPRSDGRLRMHSVFFDEFHAVPVDEPTPPGGARWSSYIEGAAWALRSAGHDVIGADLVVDGDVPLGSGLSSSSALEMAALLALCHASGIEWSPVEMALLGQRAECDYIGVEGGVMDQFTAAMGRDGHALLLDCRTLETENVPIPEDAAIVVMDTGAPRTLATSAYNDRSRTCREAVKALSEVEPGLRALRDVEPGFLEAERSLLDETSYRRARHVVDEMARPFALSMALTTGDLAEAGRLMDESHFSLRDLFEVSCRELDFVTDLARRHPACFGARLTGAGFGGCAIALVSADGAAVFAADVHAAYRAEFDLPSSVFVCRPVAGAMVIDG